MHSSVKIEDDVQKRIDFITNGTETTSQFIKKAMLERLKRMEARDKRSVKQRDEADKKAFLQMYRELKDEGVL